MESRRERGKEMQPLLIYDAVAAHAFCTQDRKSCSLLLLCRAEMMRIPFIAGCSLGVVMRQQNRDNRSETGYQRLCFFYFFVAEDPVPAVGHFLSSHISSPMS